MKKLLIDLEHCAACEECGMKCSYMHHPANEGIVALREFAHFVVICRRCEDAPCVAACPWEALEKQGDKVLKRSTMRCTSCKSCSSACPFGTIYPDTIPYIVSRCDLCLGRLKEGESPVCLQSCPHGGIQYGEFHENPAENTHAVSENLIVKAVLKWDRDIPQGVQK